MRDQVSYTYKTTEKIIVLYILIDTFLYCLTNVECLVNIYSMDWGGAEDNVFDLITKKGQMK